MWEFQFEKLVLKLKTNYFHDLLLFDDTTCGHHSCSFWFTWKLIARNTSKDIAFMHFFWIGGSQATSSSLAWSHGTSPRPWKWEAMGHGKAVWAASLQTSTLGLLLYRMEEEMGQRLLFWVWKGIQQHRSAHTLHTSPEMPLIRWTLATSFPASSQSAVSLDTLVAPNDASSTLKTIGCMDTGMVWLVWHSMKDGKLEPTTASTPTPTGWRCVAKMVRRTWSWWMEPVWGHRLAEEVSMWMCMSLWVVKSFWETHGNPLCMQEEEISISTKEAAVVARQATLQSQRLLNSPWSDGWGWILG